VRCLLDTHVWLWMLTQPERIRGEASDAIHASAGQLLLSAASSWEISMKYAIGRLPLPEEPETFVPARMRTTRVEALPVTHSHALHVASLPRHHSDPFDRLLVAQAQLEDLAIITADHAFDRYDVRVLRAA
jgi:PIN domain nuclease of toxin-antitoxin system